jgi:ribosomal protein S8
MVSLSPSGHTQSVWRLTLEWPAEFPQQGMAIVSTPKGLMSDREARTANLGGELLAVVW